MELNKVQDLLKGLSCWDTKSAKEHSGETMADDTFTGRHTNAAVPRREHGVYLMAQWGDEQKRTEGKITTEDLGLLH